MTEQEHQTALQQAQQLQDTIRAELAEARQRFHVLLDSLSDADLQRKSTNPAWTNGEILAHIIYWLAYTPRAVKYVRRHQGVRHFPHFLFNWLNIRLTRYAARKMTRQALAERYERAYEATLHVLENIQPHEWTKGATFLRNEHRTIEIIIRSHAQHLVEHAAQISR